MIIQLDSIHFIRCYFDHMFVSCYQILLAICSSFYLTNHRIPELYRFTHQNGNLPN